MPSILGCLQRVTMFALLIGATLHFAGCNTADSSSESSPQTSESGTSDTPNDAAPQADTPLGNSNTGVDANNSETPDLKSILKRTSELYQKAKVYSDNAYALVEGTQNGERFQIEQRCSLQFQSPNRIALAYDDIFATTDEQHIYAVTLDKQLPELARQVHTQRLPQKITPNWLAVESGIGQLLSTKLVSGPFVFRFLRTEASLETELAAATLTLNGIKTVDDRDCYEINVVLDEQSFTLAIDKEDFMLRQIQFPSEALPTFILDQFDPTSPRFVINFNSAKLELSDEFPLLSEIQSHPDPYYVRNFVIPPPVPSPLFGKPIEGWVLNDVGSKQPIEFEQFSGAVTVVAWLANHRAGIDTLQKLQSVKDQMASAGLANQVQFVVVWAKPTVGNQEPTLPGTDVWNGNLYSDESNFSGSRLGISNSPTVAVLDSQQRVQVLDTQYNDRLDIDLPPIIERLVDGENLVDRVFRDHQNDLATYATELHIVAADRQPIEQLPTIGPMRLRFFGLKKFDDRSVTQNIVAAGYTRGSIDPEGDYRPDRWLLSSDGRIGIFDADLRNTTVGRLPNETDLLPLSWTMRPGPKGSNLAIVFNHSGPNAYLIQKLDDDFDLTPIDLLNNEYIIAAEWVRPRGNNNLRELLISTNRGRFGAIVNGEINEIEIGLDRVVGISPLLDQQQRRVGYQAIGGDGQIEPLKDFAVDDFITSEELKTRLDFQPSPPRWLTARDQENGFTAGVGVLNNGAASFVLMDNLNKQVLNYAVAKHFARVFDSGNDPKNNIPYWIFESPQGVLHVMRSDGELFSSVSWGEPIIAANLAQQDDSLVLDIIFQNNIRSWSVSAPPLQAAVSIEPNTTGPDEIEQLPQKRP